MSIHASSSSALSSLTRNQSTQSSREKKDMDERLYEAAIRGDVEKLLDLLNEDVFIQPDETFLDRVMRDCIGKDNFLHLGALFGQVEFVREISSRKPEFARQLNSQGLSPLHLAAERGHVQVVKVLLKTDADICFVRDRDGRIPLHLAVIKGRVEVIEELVKAKNITAWLLTDEREPILHLCAKHDQFDALKKLVSLVGDDEFVRLKDSSDNTILHLLSAKKQIKMVEFLLDNTGIELEINALNVDRLTALDELYLPQWEAGFLELKKLLRGKGAKRSSDLSLPTNFPLRLTKQDSKWLKRMEPSLLVLAALVVSVTYAALLSPPGGFWQDDYLHPGSKQNHTAGDPILWSKDRTRYYMFYISNSIGFFSSLAIIAVIFHPWPYSPTYILRVLNYSTAILLISLTWSYTISLSSAASGGWMSLALQIEGHVL
ncbi:ankyrin repeat-containing protein NPR4-like protein [Cinnamomum micranthum f. kanehirae]|uniref:Ankyrin repeat-containing protein NPR4-like protein n=1 Tax=Cinnamomum micranthum f. kanehirae TaxID=337451 RepID=A0A3S3NT85_9MAGN|nr:ankyrin repeat-containing protein NPR4-like protein [Cinnamomum micranthum f. kanehirae]